MDLPRYHTCASPPTCRIYVHPFRNSFGLIDRRRLSRDTRLTSDSCSSGWCFVIGFLHRGCCLPRLAELLVLPLFGRTADFHRIDTCALLGAQQERPAAFRCGRADCYPNALKVISSKPPKLRRDWGASLPAVLPRRSIRAFLRRHHARPCAAAPE